MKYGYTRVSILSKDLESQIQTLENESCEKIHSEKFTGTKADRPQFQNLDKKHLFFSPGKDLSGSAFTLASANYPS